MKIFRLICFIYCLHFLQPIASQAEGNFLQDHFDFNGFGTMALTTADSDELGFRSHIGQNEGTFSGDVSWKQNSLLGFQLNGNFANGLDGAVQLVLKERPQTDFENYVQLAFLGYRPTHDIRVRTGRLQADIYMLTDCRDIGFAYLWARPIVEFYGVIPFQSIDGIDGTWSPRLAGGILHINLFGGWTSFSATSMADEEIQVEASPIGGFHLLFEKKYWQFRGGITRLKYKNTSQSERIGQIKNGLSFLSMFFPSAAKLASDIEIDGSSSTYSAIGALYDSPRWLIQSEFAWLDSESTFMPSAVSGYLSIGYRIANFTPYGTFAAVEMTSDVYQKSTIAQYPPGMQWAKELYEHGLTVANIVRVNQHTFSLGTRWDIAERTALKFQWSHTRARDNGTALWMRDNITDKIDNLSINIFTLNLSFTF